MEIINKINNSALDKLFNKMKNMEKLDEIKKITFDINGIWVEYKTTINGIKLEDKILINEYKAEDFKYHYEFLTRQIAKYEYEKKLILILMEQK